MYHIQDDPRSIRSGEMIFEGLARVMQEKDFSKISVTDVVKAAQVGRTTFYRHFDEIEDVLQMRCDQFVEGLITYLRAYRQKQPDAHVSILRPVLQYSYRHSDLLEMLIKAKRTYLFEEAFLSYFEPFKPLFGAYFGIEEEYVDYVIVMRVSAITKILSHWIATGKEQSPDELADRLGAITSQMIAIEQLM